MRVIEIQLSLVNSVRGISLRFKGGMSLRLLPTKFCPALFKLGSFMPPISAMTIADDYS